MTVANTDAARAALQGQQGQEGQPPQRQKTIAEWMDDQKPMIGKALGSAVDADRFVMFALTAVKQTPDLIQCTPESMLSALMLSAQVGLEPGPFGYVYLNPRNRKIKGQNGERDRWIKEVQFSIGYKGLVVLAQRSPEIRKVQGYTVYANDVFSVEYGLNENLIHKPNLTSDRGEVVGAYAVAEWVNGAKSFVYLTREDIDKRRAAAGKGGESGPWQTHYEQMARKSAVRDLANFLPLDTDAAQVIALDDQVHTNPTKPLHEREPEPFDEDRFQESMAALEGQPHEGPVPSGEDVEGVVVPDGPDDPQEPPQGDGEGSQEPPPAPAKKAAKKAAAQVPETPVRKPGEGPPPEGFSVT